MIEIMENSIIEWLPMDADSKPVLERVLWCDPGKEFFIVIDMNLEKSLPAPRTYEEFYVASSQEKVVYRNDDPHDTLRNPNQVFLAKHSEHIKKNWSIIEKIVTQEPDIYFPESRGRLISSVLDKATKPYIYVLLRRYWVKGKFQNALAPAYSNCGGRNKRRIVNLSAVKRGRPSIVSKVNPEITGINVDSAIHTIFRWAYKSLYDTSKENPLRRAYEKMVELHFSRKDAFGNVITLPDNQKPTFGQFDYWYRQEKDLEKSLILRRGIRNYNLKNRPLLCGSTGLAPGPGSLYQIDATIADVYLVSRFNRLLIIGRPVIYFCIDVFSRMVVGLHVALEGPSWTTGMMALANSFLDKVEFCSRYGISIAPDDWPVQGKPRKITADRGEFFSINSDFLVENLDITMANCPPFRADWKGIIEQTFRKSNDTCIKWLPGAVRKREFGEPNPMYEAKLDIHQFTQLLIYMALHHNLHHRLDTDIYPLDRDLMRDGVEPIPIELWHWGIQNRSGRMRDVTPQAVMLSLMPRDKARITKNGITFNKMYYNCNSAMHGKWFVRARHQGSWSIDISYDPRRPETIYYHTGDGGVETCYRIEENDLNKRFEGLNLEEIQEYQAVEKLNAALYRPIELQSRVTLNQICEKIVQEGTAMTDRAIAESNGVRKALRCKDIRANAAQENASIRHEQAWDLDGLPQDKITQVPEDQTISALEDVSLVKDYQQDLLDQIDALEQAPI